MERQEEIKNLFDYKDGELYRKNGKKAGTIRPNGYKQVWMKGKTHLSHRVIFMMFHGYLPKCIDHINNNKTDNRIENLREATHSENNYNSKLRKTTKSGCKNVHWAKDKNKWIVRTIVNKKFKFIGAFKDFELAELVSIEARNKYHKDFARHK